MHSRPEPSEKADFTVVFQWLGIGGEGWIRTSVRLRGQIYSLLPLTTRPPLQVLAGAPHAGAGSACQRVRGGLSSGVPPTSSERFAIYVSGLNNRKIGAGEGNRTLVVSLEGFCSTIELHPHFNDLAAVCEDFLQCPTENH